MEIIRLERTLPRVFRSETIPHSDVWQCAPLFRRGETYLIESASGGGKSSFCSFIYGARTDYDGTILFDSRDIREIDMVQWLALRRTSLAYLPQELGLFGELTAWENIQLKNSLTGHLSPGRIGEWLDMLGIADRRDTPACRMSVGQQQRVAIIRALCQPFDFLLIDEPVSHLDAANNRIAAGIVAEEARRQGAGIISTSVGNPLSLDYTKTLRL